MKIIKNKIKSRNLQKLSQKNIFIFLYQNVRISNKIIIIYFSNTLLFKQSCKIK